jgi:hypothetical protein
MYRLQYNPGIEAVHDLLPDALSLRFSEALARACEDPIAHTEPYGIDDGVTRTLVVGDVFAVLLIGHQTKTLTVLAASYLG